jgi:hypothetical protein
MTKIKQFVHFVRGLEFYGLAEVQTIESLPVIVRVTDLYLEGYMDDRCGAPNNPPDMKDIVDYQIILDIEDMIAKNV